MADNPTFDRYTDRARRALVIAQAEARNLGHAHIGSGHLLLGLIGEDGGVAAQALKSLGATLDDARRTVARAEDRAPGQPTGALPFTSRLSAVLELATREAVMLGNSYIATEHLLLALAEGSAPGASPLVAIGVNPDDARAKVLDMLRGYEEAGKRPGAPEPGIPPADDLPDEDPLAILDAMAEHHQRVRDHGELPDFEAVPKLIEAVKAALVHHQPAETANGIRVCPLCSSADGKAVTAPCHEVRAITRELTGEADDKPCKCHQSFAWISPTHEGHCCFIPAGQTCHPEAVAEWERQRYARREGGRG